jgi:NADP-dependent 3-hydroxy acid dehydrogenase YdfG
MTLKDVHEKPLAEQVAVVSGAARGIGEAISLRLASLGAHVILTARDKDKLEAVEAAIHRDGGSASTHPVDLRDAAAVEALGLAVRERYQRCDILMASRCTR